MERSIIQYLSAFIMEQGMGFTISVRSFSKMSATSVGEGRREGYWAQLGVIEYNVCHVCGVGEGWEPKFLPLYFNTLFVHVSQNTFVK